MPISAFEVQVHLSLPPPQINWRNIKKTHVEISPVLGNKHIPVLWHCPRLAASSHYLITICCVYQIAGDKPPPLFSQSSVAVSALQLFRAHISTCLSIPVQAEVLEMQPWREKLQRRSPDFTLSAELSSSFHKLVSFSLNANLVIVLYKVFPLTAPAALLPPHQFFPVTILDRVQGGLAAVLPRGRIMLTVRGKMPGKFNTSGNSDLEHPRHAILFSCLYFPW